MDRRRKEAGLLPVRLLHLYHRETSRVTGRPPEVRTSNDHSSTLEVNLLTSNLSKRGLRSTLEALPRYERRTTTAQPSRKVPERDVKVCVCVCVCVCACARYERRRTTARPSKSIEKGTRERRQGPEGYREEERGDAGVVARLERATTAM